MAGDRASALDARTADALQEIFSGLPGNYADASEYAAILWQEFHERLRQTIEPFFVEHAKSLPCESYEQKKDTASWINHEVRRFGLRLRCPDTGKPATLCAESAYPGNSRFAYFVTNPDHRRVRTYSGKSLPDLSLMVGPTDEFINQRRSSRGK